MALIDAIMEIACEMEEEAKNEELALESRFTLRTYAKQLKTAVKVSDGLTHPPLTSNHQLTNPILLDANYQNFLGVEKAKEELRRERSAKLLDEEKSNPGMAIVVGGVCDGNYVAIPPEMPVGAFAPIGSEVYELRSDQKLHYSEVETRLMQQQYASTNPVDPQKSSLIVPS